jgi:shikimate dehydrogenase
MVDYLTPKRYRLGLIGYPLEHSLSPPIHTAALEALDLNGEYLLYLIPPSTEGARKLEGLMSQLRSGQVHGLNVTIPHKQAVIPFMDDLTPTARSIGAVNTIFIKDKRLIGDNTDVPGFLADLDRFASVGAEPFSKNPQTAIVLGAGGAARAVVYALTERGWNITIAARKVEQALRMINSFQQSTVGGHLSVIKLDEASLKNVKKNSSLIINTTPLGMFPHVGTSPWPEGLRFPTGAIIYDLVYNPPKTVIVRKAEEAGLMATTGLGMLVEQAALAFERWTGHTAPRDAMWQAAQGV